MKVFMKSVVFYSTTKLHGWDYVIYTRLPFYLKKCLVATEAYLRGQQPCPGVTHKVSVVKTMLSGRDCSSPFSANVAPLFPPVCQQPLPSMWSQGSESHEEEPHHLHGKNSITVEAKAKCVPCGN